MAHGAVKFLFENLSRSRSMSFCPKAQGCFVKDLPQLGVRTRLESLSPISKSNSPVGPTPDGVVGADLLPMLSILLKDKILPAGELRVDSVSNSALLGGTSIITPASPSPFLRPPSDDAAPSESPVQETELDPGSTGSAFFSGNRLDRRAAERAGGVRVEPHVYAVNVEGVAALGQEPDDLPLLELRQANGALRRRRSRSVERNREGVQNRSVEAAVGGCSLGDPGVEVHDDLAAAEAAVEAAALDLTAAEADDVPPGVEVEGHHEDDDGEEDDDGAQHNPPTQSVFSPGLRPKIIAIPHAINSSLFRLKNN
ncbi:aspartate aminotransferase B [Striga asiatica]|uniref:Aspartate aminotransferase B n=1 Tax=Striga asiatica TaxID=4170 RepID=A0A5A7R7B3_STRAF|nr:aspartate aminotransferase B [Striga asiatica]